MTEDKRKAILLKLKKAKAFLNEADILFQNKFYTTVINRLYYSCFHATKALLLIEDIIPKTHSGVVNQLHLHFVQKDRFEMEQASFFSRLMQERIEDDYSDNLEEDAESTHQFIEPARKYVSYVELLVMKIIS
ncbi:MAG: HEPN domain-containing protein [Bacteroidota bacterium]